MARRTYVEPPMKFDIALRKYVPDLPQKPQKNSQPINEKEIRNITLVCFGFFIILFAIYYFFFYPT